MIIDMDTTAATPASALLCPPIDQAQKARLSQLRAELYGALVRREEQRLELEALIGPLTAGVDRLRTDVERLKSGGKSLNAEKIGDLRDAIVRLEREEAILAELKSRGEKARDENNSLVRNAAGPLRGYMSGLARALLAKHAEHLEPVLANYGLLGARFQEFFVRLPLYQRWEHCRRYLAAGTVLEAPEQLVAFADTVLQEADGNFILRL